MLLSLSDVRRAVVKRERPVLLRCPVEEHPTPPRGFDLISHGCWHPGVQALHEAWGRDLTEERLRLRFARGLRFYALSLDGVACATTWAVVHGERFVDEIALGFPVSDSVLWWRDIFVAPEFRGRGVFTALLDSVLATGFAGRREMWSAVAVDNRPSIWAHRRRGFLPVCEYDVLHLMGWVVARLRWPPGPPVGSAYQPGRRLIWTGQRYRSFVADRLA
jgi:GNAT superfamily N-acetyltransferase